MRDETRRHLRVTVRSNTFMNDPPDAEIYYNLLGKILVLWSRLENSLGHALLSICNSPYAENFRPKEMPIAFKKKVTLWRLLFSKIDELASMKRAAIELIEDATDTAHDRHVLVHGHFDRFTKATPLTARFVHIKHKRNNAHLYNYEISIEQLQDITTTIDELILRLVPILWNICSLSNISPPPTKSIQE